jgi:PPP family 3-phenylpropionic acid transporter
MLYGAFGLASPFMPRLFESRGLTQPEIGTVLAAGLLMRLAAGPLIGRLADRSRRLRAALGLCLALAAAASAAMAGAHGFILIFGLALAQAGALAPTTSIADALAVSAEPPGGRKGRFEYGWIRGGASLAFVLGTLLAGQLIRADDLAPAIWANAILLLAAAGLTIAPSRSGGTAERPAVRSESSPAALRALLRLSAFRGIIAVAALVYGSHAMYDAFAVIRWNAAGLDPAVISVLWSEAVAAEVVVFLLIGPALIRRLGPRGAAVLAAVAGIVRWSVLASTSSFAALLAIQPLHGLTFALLHLACMRLMGNSVPPRLAATAQTLYAFGPAAVTALLTWASGWLYGTGQAAFLLMTGLCAVAVPVAWLGWPARQDAVGRDGALET